jgi:hypothetical protein
VSKRGPDFQKREAKQCLWDQDGQHTAKRARNRGKGRGKDKKLVRAYWEEEDFDDEGYSQEISDALYCLEYGPCPACQAKK